MSVKLLLLSVVVVEVEIEAVAVVLLIQYEQALMLEPLKRFYECLFSFIHSFFFLTFFLSVFPQTTVFNSLRRV